MENQSNSLSVFQRVKQLLILGRPKFLAYSLACQSVGTLVAALQGNHIDLASFGLLQSTIWLTHLGTHYINEYGDYEVDMLNANAGAWTGGSKVLKNGVIHRNTALTIGKTLLGAATVAGACCVARYASIRLNVPLPNPLSLSSLASYVRSVLASTPWTFVSFGLSTFFVAAAYSLPPLRLSANALGEVCVAYVLTFATPAVGCLMQDGHVTLGFVKLLLPLMLANLSRMIVMNIPDREGDSKGGKTTSVVLVGEEKAVVLNNGIYIATYLVVLPSLGLPLPLQLAYYATLPLRWWISLHVNVSKWWTDKHLTDAVPFYESMFVLTTVSALCVGLAAQLRAGDAMA